MTGTAKIHPRDRVGCRRMVDCESYRVTGNLLLQGSTDVDEIIGDHGEANPALHTVFASVAAAVQSVSPLDHADASLTSGAPFLTVAEPSLPLFASSLLALG